MPTPPRCAPQRRRHLETPPASTGSSKHRNKITFDYSLLNTRNPSIQAPKRKTSSQLRESSTRQLRALDKAPNKPDGLALLIAGIRELITQDWEILLVYFDPESELPKRERSWSHGEWTKWELVAFLTRIATQYCEACGEAERDDAVLCTRDVDAKFLRLLYDVLDLGVKAEGIVIEIKEWEREGTIALLEAEGLETMEMS